MANDSFERFSDLGATLANPRPVPGASLHSTILGEDNLIVGATLISSTQGAAMDIEGASAAIAASPEDPVAGLPEKPGMTFPQGAVAQPAEAADLARDERPGSLWPRSGRSDVNKITWARVGSIAEPGRYAFRFGWLSITAADLSVWRQFPNASFTLCQTAQAHDEREYRLGAFDIGNTDAS